MTAYIEQCKQVVNQIFEEDYYVDLWKRVSSGYDFEKLTESQWCNLLNRFWAALPDSQSIRRPPFFELCNCCEKMFDSDLE